MATNKYNLPSSVVVYLQAADKRDGAVQSRQQGVNPPVMVFPTRIPGPGCAFFPFRRAHLVYSAHDHPLIPLLTAPVAAAMVARETTTLLATSRHGRSVPPPWPVYRAASVSLSPSRWSAGAAATVGVRPHAASKSCGTSDTRPTGGVRPLRLCTA